MMAIKFDWEGQRFSISQKQESFCHEFVANGFNAVQAATTAGYKSPKASGSENLAKPAVQARIAKLVTETETSAGQIISKDRVLSELARLAFFDIRKIYNPDGSLKRVIDLDDDTAAALVSTKVRKLVTEEGAAAANTETEVKLADKKGALELLGRHLRLFTDVRQLQNPDGSGIGQGLGAFYDGASQDG